MYFNYCAVKNRDSSYQESVSDIEGLEGRTKFSVVQPAFS